MVWLRLLRAQICFPRQGEPGSMNSTLEPGWNEGLKSLVHTCAKEIALTLNRCETLLPYDLSRFFTLFQGYFTFNLRNSQLNITELSIWSPRISTRPQLIDDLANSVHISYSMKDKKEEEEENSFGPCFSKGKERLLSRASEFVLLQSMQRALKAFFKTTTQAAKDWFEIPVPQ